MKAIKTTLLFLFPFVILFADFDRSSVLIDVPTCQILPKNSFTFTYTGSFGLERIPSYSGDRYYEDGGNIRMGIGNRLELSMVAYTRENFTVGFTYLFLKPEAKSDWALAWGIHDIGLKGDVSPKGSGLDKAWFDDHSYERTAGLKPAENFSIFCVGTKSINDFLRLHIGLGRGRYVGYGDRNKYLNTDIFFNEKHQWAFGLFGALEFHIQDFLRVGLEGDGRDINCGLQWNLGPIQMSTSISKIEALLWGGNYERFSFGLSYNISAFRPKPVPPLKRPIYGAIYGKVFDEEDKKPLEAKISLETPTTHSQTLTDAAGEFALNEIAEGEAKITIEKDGYETEEQELTVIAGRTENIEVGLKKRNVGKEEAPTAAPSFAIIYFNFNEASLRPDMEEAIRNNLKILKENPNLKLVIEGHTCEIGSEEYNFYLGEKRAETVYNYLLNHGIPATRMQKVSYGKTKPRVKEPLSENRRVEFRVDEDTFRKAGP